jgi:flagellar biosynthesis protein FlhG
VTLPSQNHYEVLGINAQASPDEVERAYRFTLELYGDGALATYSLLDPAEVRRARARVQEAYEVLRDPARRHAYDQSHGLATGPMPRAIHSNVRAWPQPAHRVDAVAAPLPARSGAAVPAATPVPFTPPVPSAAVAAAAPAPAPFPAGPAAGGPSLAREPEAGPSSLPVEPLPSLGADVPRAAAAQVPLPAPGAAALRPSGTPSFGRTAHVLPEPITGSVLRRYREERGVSLREIANQSKIGTRYLEYIEGDRLDMLPAAVYLRGFLQEYARALGLDPRRTANAYMAQFPRPWPQE